MPDIKNCVFIFSLLTANVLSDRPIDSEESQQGGKSLFLLGGLFRRIISRWQNQNIPPSPYGGGPIFTGYFGCPFYSCRPPPPLQVVQPIQAIQPVQQLPPVVQTPIVVQQAQVYQPAAYAQAVAPPNQGPIYPPPTPPQTQPVQYPPQPTYGSPQPAYGNLQPYQPYPVPYPPAYPPPVPGQIYQNAGCAYPGYICARKT